MNKNILISLLEILEVKHTKSNANKYFNEHSDKDNLLGLSELLNIYAINNIAIRQPNSEVENIKTPFVIYTGKQFILVEKITSDKIRCKIDDKKITLTPHEFKKIKNGILLIVEKQKTSIEPDYKHNRKIELFNKIKKISFYLSISVIFSYAFLSEKIYNNLSQILILIINTLGVATCIALVQKSLNTENSYVKKICTFSKQTSCDDILASKYSKFIGLISWSEIGLTYFLSNILLLLFLPHYIYYQSFINILVLPFTIWSIWFQKVRIKKWCPLCLVIQCLLIATFIINLSFRLIQYPQNISIINIPAIILCFLITFLVINFYVNSITQEQKIENINYEINKIKTNKQVFDYLLTNQTNYNANISTSCILFGNKDSDTLITIITNPHCGACMEIHQEIEDLLEQKHNICVQYIFTTFKTNLAVSNKILIAAYINNNTDEIINIYNKWFDNKEETKSEITKEYIKYINSDNVESEYQKQMLWINSTKLRNTPTILINGYILPSIYKLQDLIQLL